MNIQNCNYKSGISFQATKVLSAKKKLPKAKQDVIEVFRLNREEDYGFIKQCNDLFVKNKKLKLSLFEKRCKSLFSDLLVKANASCEDFYIAVKNSETITGCMNSVPFMRNVIPLNLFTRESKAEDVNLLFYALLKDSQKKYIGFDIKMDVLATKTSADKSLIEFRDIDTVKNTIKEELLTVKFRAEEKKVNLYDVFGARDFETEIYPNLK